VSGGRDGLLREKVVNNKLFFEKGFGEHGGARGTQWRRAFVFFLRGMGFGRHTNKSLSSQLADLTTPRQHLTP
jgi:hypothetical protein